MARPTANLRLFAAIYPPSAAQTQLARSIQTLELPPHRAVAPEQIHLTVQFIGDTPSADLDVTSESLQRATAGLASFSLQPMRLISLPERGPSRLVAMECEPHPTLMEIHRRLVVRLARNVRQRDRERFRPHLTLCRFRSPARGLRIDQPVSLEAFPVMRVVLMRSTLSSDGASHHEVAWSELG
jgi:2'-5' RNA ligase